MQNITRASGAPVPGKLQIDKWLIKAKKVPNPGLRLFCFAHAGGSAVAYHHWHKDLPENVEVCAVQLPGRGHRMREELIDDFDAMAEALTRGLIPHLKDASVPFAFFGHSMGAMLAFEVTRRLRRLALTQPIHLLVSGCRAPQFSLGRDPIHHLGEQDFIGRLRAYNGTPAEALENAELMAMIAPMLRADFRIVETRQHVEENPLNIPISCFGGLQDNSVDAQHLQGWRQHTNSGFWQQMFPGDHFYLLQNSKPLLRQITDLLCLAIQMRSQPQNLLMD